MDINRTKIPLANSRIGVGFLYKVQWRLSLQMDPVLSRENYVPVFGISGEWLICLQLTDGLSYLVLLSRLAYCSGCVTGFLREIGIASVFGISTEADITILMLTIPDVLVNLLVAGGLSAALIPEFKALALVALMRSFIRQVVFGVPFHLSGRFLNYFVAELSFILAPGLSDGVALVAQRLVSDSLWLIPLSIAASVSTAFYSRKNVS